MNICINKKQKEKIYGIVVALAVMAGAIAAFPLAAFAAGSPAEAGTYILTATSYYTHPVTGVIEDSGQNPGIGQGMTESVLAGNALLEVYEDGGRYVTVRFSLMDNISDVKMSVQKDAESEFEPVDYGVTKENADAGSADIRFAVPDEDVIARAELYVEPMGRDIIFFMTFTNPVPGAGDFAADRKAGESSGESPPEAEAKPAAESSPEPVPEPEPQAAETPGDETTVFILAAILIVVVVAFAGVVIYFKKAKKR
ncbi:hypothetical protein AGMMS49983_09890 [Clostridia bacterium]|nr:hypothetical protein AGMMS49983_09890 [Clostridia bacterium]